MRDFTLSALGLLLRSLKSKEYEFITFENFLTKTTAKKQVILRHDVDNVPQNSLKTAMLEHSLEIKGSYYFRITKESNNPEIIQSIVSLGHEIGYHYEDLAIANGNQEDAIKHFEENLKYFRQYYPVKTICMHGSPMSRWDNRALWKKYNYKTFGIIGEPYFDIDFNNFCYLTDTGRKWNGGDVSIRDKVISAYHFNFEKTFTILENIDKLPNQLMITIHPQRWNDSLFPWIKELVFQNSKNIIKRIIASPTPRLLA